MFLTHKQSAIGNYPKYKDNYQNFGITYYISALNVILIKIKSFKSKEHYLL